MQLECCDMRVCAGADHSHPAAIAGMHGCVGQGTQAAALQGQSVCVPGAGRQGALQMAAKDAYQRCIMLASRPCALSMCPYLLSTLHGMQLLAELV